MTRISMNNTRNLISKFEPETLFLFSIFWKNHANNKKKHIPNLNFLNSP